MLFELCDLGTLGNWLLGHNKVTEDLEDKMITFSLQVARGLQQLHEHKVTLYDLMMTGVVMLGFDIRYKYCCKKQCRLADTRVHLDITSSEE